MRFFRIARILNIPEILQFLHILRSSNSIRLTRMLCLLFTVWLSAAGFVHLVNRSVFFDLELSIIVRFVFLGGEFGRFLLQLFQFAANHLLPMCLFSDRYHEVMCLMDRHRFDQSISYALACLVRLAMATTI